MHRSQIRGNAWHLDGVRMQEYIQNIYKFLMCKNFKFCIQNTSSSKEKYEKAKFLWKPWTSGGKENRPDYEINERYPLDATIYLLL